MVKSSVSDSIPQDLEITNSNAATNANLGGIFEVQGQIQNTGSATATATAIYATFYDSSGKVVDTASGYPSTPDVASSSSSSFVLSPYDETQLSLFASYSLIAISDTSISNYATGSTNSSPSTTATPTSSPSTTVAPTSPSSTTSATPVTPEFPYWIILPLFAAMLLTSIAFIRNRTTKK